MTTKPTYSQEKIGEYLICYGQNQNECKYIIYLHEKVVNKGICSTKEKARKAVENFISTRKKDMVSKRVDGIPTSQEFAEAINAIKPSDNQWEMLKAHYHAPNRKLTSSQLAEAAGFQHFYAANTQYGTLGREIARYLEINPLGKYKNGDPLWITTITEENSESIDLDTGHYQHILRDEVAEALEVLGVTIKP